jgi:hypothetical protein
MLQPECFTKVSSFHGYPFVEGELGKTIMGTDHVVEKEKNIASRLNGRTLKRTWF